MIMVPAERAGGIGKSLSLCVIGTCCLFPLFVKV